MRPACVECGLIVGHYESCSLNVQPIRVRDSWVLATLIASDPAQAWTA